MNLSCEYSPCRERVSAEDIDKYYREWDKIIQSALNELKKVRQPLLCHLDSNTKRQLDHYLDTGRDYISVLALKRTK